VVVLGHAAVAPAADKVVFNYRPEVTSADVLIALDEGFFADEGLEIESTPWKGNESMLPPLAQGKLDVVITGSFSPSHVNVIHRGARVRLVRARSVHAPGECSYDAYVARPELIDSGRLAGIETLRGLRIGTDRTSATLYLWERLLAQAGLTIDDVETVDLATNVRALALDRGLVDVVSLTEPRVYHAVSSGHGKVWRGVNDALPGHQKTFMMFGPRLLDQRRDLGSKVMRAIARATRQYVDQGKSERNVEIIARHSRMTPELVRALCWPRWSVDGRIDGPHLEAMQAWALGKGLIDAAVPTAGLVDEGFLRAIEPSAAHSDGTGEHR
jgi:NitT/TauT family transport system substrate-binding protein